jgi:hypothetical protein
MPTRAAIHGAPQPLEALECAAGSLLRLPVWAARAEAAWLAGDDETARRAATEGLTVSGTADAWLAGSLRRWIHLAGGRSGAAITLVTPYDLEIDGDWCAAAQEWTRRGCPYDEALAQLGGDIAAVESALATFRPATPGPTAHRVVGGTGAACCISGLLAGRRRSVGLAFLHQRPDSNTDGNHRDRQGDWRNPARLHRQCQRLTGPRGRRGIGRDMRPCLGAFAQVNAMVRVGA